MQVSRRELLGYAVAGTTGMAVRTAAGEFQGASAETGGAVKSDTQAPDPEAANVGQHWQLGGVYARPAEIEDTAITFRGSVRSSYKTDYEVATRLYYRPKREGESNREDKSATERNSWTKIAEETGPLSEGVYLEATETDLEEGTTYQYWADAALTNYRGQSYRVSEVQEVTAGQPCSGPSTNCLRVETLAPEISESGASDGNESDSSGGNVTFRGRARGLASYDEVTGRFFYWPKGDSEGKQWTDYEQIESEEGSDTGEFSATLWDLSAGTYRYYAEVRGVGGGQKNMYAEGGEKEFRIE